MKDATLKQARKILELFEDTPNGQLQALLGSGLLTDLRDANIAEVKRDEFRRLIGLKPFTPELMRQAYAVTVNYDLSLEEMIAAGRYDWVNPDITAEHFPVKGKGTVEVETQLVHFNCVMESDGVIHELDTMGLRPAAIEVLLAFGVKYPGVQREFPIVALKSAWRGRFGVRCVVCLGGGGSERRLRLDVFEGGWVEHYRFLAVRK